jgi:RNA polymerase sigma factor (sigma-70 family)
MPEIDARKLLAHAKDLSTRYARHLGPDEAADLAAEAVARGLERPPADGKMEPWVERIARNLLVDRWRRAQVAERCPPDCPEPTASPEELVLAGERRRTLRRSLARLHRDQRRSILHRYYAEGAPLAGLSATTLRTRLHRGLGRLRELTRGLLSAFPPVRLGHWLSLAANPAAAAFLLLAQQSPAPPPTRLRLPPPFTTVRSRPGPRSRRSGRRGGEAAAAARARPPRRAALRLRDDEVTGEIEDPNVPPIYGERKVRLPSLIEIPRDFVPAVAKSVEDL